MSESPEEARTRMALRSSFDSAAALYQHARPTYPATLFDDLVEIAELEPGDRLLEIGCGTGQATLPLLQRGFRIVCVELGESLASLARQTFRSLPVEIHRAAFEDWAGEPGGFDLVYAATAWAWIDPDVRYRKAHRLLRRGGHLALWSATHAFPEGFDPFFTDIQAVYDAIGEGWAGTWPPPPPEALPDQSAEIEHSGLFEDVQVRRYVWEVSYSAEEYTALLDTFSGHIAMPAYRRERLYAEIRRMIGERSEPRIRRHWSSILHVARASADPDV